MGLKAGRTKWVLFLGAKQDPEQRHVLDLAFGVVCLESAGISSHDIEIYVDGNDRQFVDQFIHTGTQNKYAVGTSADFFTSLAQNTHDNLMMFVTGHGSMDGIDAPTSILPYALLQAVKGAPALQQAVLYLGQCHAGIFNYIGAGNSISGGKGANVIIVGATNLHDSLSTSTSEDLAGKKIVWVANLFLLHVFKWISNPVDVDGDGLCTVMDSYKYAGIMTNNGNKLAKMRSLVALFDLHARWRSAEAALKATPTVQLQLAFQALTTQYENMLASQYTHQESWILNAIPAQRLDF